MKKANLENRVLITRDKDFGELVFRMRQVNSGVILVRLEEVKSALRSQIVFQFISENLGLLTGHFIVLQPSGARIRTF